LRNGSLHNWLATADIPRGRARLLLAGPGGSDATLSSGGHTIATSRRGTRSVRPLDDAARAVCC
jgi:hypothetical protein